MPFLLVVFLVAFRLIATVLAQPSSSAITQVVELGGPVADIRFPLTVTQCEPALIYYNTTGNITLSLFPPELDNPFLILHIPSGQGFLEWICNVPAGYGFAVAYLEVQFYVVLPGSSSLCLHNITTTYQQVAYITTAFEKFTENPPNTVTPLLSYPASTVSFLGLSYATITANPDLAIPLATSLPSSSSTSRNPSPSTTHPSSTFHKRKIPLIAGCVIGGVTMFLLTISIIYIFLWRRRRLHAKEAENLPRTILENLEVSARQFTPVIIGRPVFPMALPLIMFRAISRTGTYISSDLAVPSLRSSTATPMSGDRRHAPNHPDSPSLPPLVYPTARKPSVSTSTANGSVNPAFNRSTDLLAVSSRHMNAGQRDLAVTSFYNAAVRATMGTQPISARRTGSPNNDSSGQSAAADSSRQGSSRRHTFISMVQDLTNPEALAALTRGNTRATVPIPPNDLYTHYHYGGL